MKYGYVLGMVLLAACAAPSSQSSTTDSPAAVTPAPEAPPVMKRKRVAPEEVTPIEVNGIRYTAPQFDTATGEKMIGYIVATNTASHKEVWKKQLYTVKIDSSLETDVQEYFINGLSLEGDTLRVTDERGGKYWLNLKNKTSGKE